MAKKSHSITNKHWRFVFDSQSFGKSCRDKESCQNTNIKVNIIGKQKIIGQDVQFKKNW